MKGTDNMIVRVSRVRVKSGQETAFEAFIREQAVPFMKQHQGIRDFTFGWCHMHPSEFLFTSWWASLEDIKRFAGKDWKKSVVLPGEAHMVNEMICEHYETLTT